MGAYLTAEACVQLRGAVPAPCSALRIDSDARRPLPMPRKRLSGQRYAHSVPDDRMLHQRGRPNRDLRPGASGSSAFGISIRLLSWLLAILLQRLTGQRNRRRSLLLAVRVRDAHHASSSLTFRRRSRRRMSPPRLRSRRSRTSVVAVLLRWSLAPAGCLARVLPLSPAYTTAAAATATPAAGTLLELLRPCRLPRLALLQLRLPRCRPVQSVCRRRPSGRS